MPKSEQLKREFLTKYGLDVTFEQATERGMNVKNKLKYVDSFLFETKRPDIKAQKYLETLIYLLNRAVEIKLPPKNSNKEYDVSDINAREFIRQYENIIQTEHEEKNPGVPRKKNEGIGGMVLARAEATMKGYKKPLYAVWADRIRAEIYNVEDLRKMTDDIYDQSRVRVDNDGNDLDEELPNAGAIATACEIHAALKQAIRQRTIGWYLYPGNWSTWRRENSYLKHLDQQITEYKSLPGFSDEVEPILDEYHEPINTSVDEITELKTKYIQQIQQKKLAKANAKPVNADKVDAEKEKEEKVTVDVNILQEKVNEVLMYSDFRDDFVKEVLPELPAGGITDEDKTDILKPNISFCVIQPMKKANAEFVSTNGDPDTVKEAALEIFCQTVESITNLYPDDDVATLLAAQIITDKAMQKLSAAGVYPKQYGEFAKGYAINHFDELKDKNYIASYRFDEECYQKAVESYNDLSKPQKIQIENLDDQKNTEIVDKIKEEPHLVKDNIIID